MAKWRRQKSLPRIWQRKHLLAKYGNTCYLCGKPIEQMKDITIDHWEPVSKGGLDDIGNYRLAHYACNHLKADLTPEEFVEFQKGNLAYE